MDVEARLANVLFNRVPPTQTQTKRDTFQSNVDIMATLDGSLFKLPGGDLRFSVGAGVLDQDYRGIRLGGGVSTRALGRKTTYAFAEIFAPLIGKEQSIPLVRRLELSLAGRYTSYEDTSTPSVNQEFGDSTDPKVGLLWAPLDDLSFRGTYGTSFRAPSLTELDPTGATNLLMKPFTADTLAARIKELITGRKEADGWGA